MQYHPPKKFNSWENCRHLLDEEDYCTRCGTFPSQRDISLVNQISLLDTESDPADIDYEAEQKKREGRQAAGDHANPEWMDKAYSAGKVVAKRRQYFTCDVVSEYMERVHPLVVTHDGRALGNIMDRLQNAGVIEALTIDVPELGVSTAIRVIGRNKSPIIAWKSKWYRP